VQSLRVKILCPQVEQLLLSEPENQEYAEIYRSLTEAIELTEELLKETAPGFSGGRYATRHLPSVPSQPDFVEMITSEG